MATMFLEKHFGVKLWIHCLSCSVVLVLLKKRNNFGSLHCFCCRLGNVPGSLTDTMTQYIIPVELNAILCWNAELLSEFFNTLHMANKTLQYRQLADWWLEAVDNVLWHDEVGIWLDYDMISGVKHNRFYPTNLAPLWTGCFKRRNLQVGKIMKYLERSQIMTYLGGIPTSLEHSGEQWDYPNAWPPLQYIVIMALEATEDVWAQNLAVEIARKWVRSNFKTFNESHVMYEKVCTLLGLFFRYF